mgnify:CR=1 FL=1
MQSTGIIRKLDALGRITLPKELRKSFDLTDDEDFVEIFVDKDMIILKKYVSGDVFTGECDELIEYHGLRVSRNTIQKLIEIAGFCIGK